MTPKVSIILPIYNVEKYLDRCMNSLLEQTLKEIEIIMVDDGSPDKCPALCDEYAKKDSRIKVVHKKNEGLGLARNSGLDVATGEYIAFLDSDDYVDINTYGKLYDTAIENGKPQAIFCGLNKVNDTGKVYAGHSDYDVFTPITGNESCKRVAAEMVARLDKVRKPKYFMSVWHAIYKRDFLEQNGIKFCSEREFMSEDIIFHINFFSYADNIVYIPDRLIYYCDNGASLSRSFDRNRFGRYVGMYHKIQELMHHYNYPKEYLLSAHKYIIIASRGCIYSFFNNIPGKNERMEYIREITGKRDLWNIVRKSGVRRILATPLLLYYIPLIFGVHSILYMYCNKKTKKSL